MVANQNFKTYVTARVKEFITPLDLNDIRLLGVVPSVVPSVTLTETLARLHQNLHKRSLEWVERNVDSKGISLLRVVEKDNLWFCVYSDTPSDVFPGLGNWQWDFVATDYRGTLRRIIRNSTI